MLVLASGPVRLTAHESLYHYVELTLPREGRGGEIAFSVHAADLAAAVVMGADPLASDLAWLANAEADETANLLDEARKFVFGTVFFEIDGKPCDGGGLHFPDADRLRSGSADAEAARPGFLVGSLALEKTVATVSLRLSPTSGKRLLLVVNRPRAFPEIQDLAPGDTATIALTDS